MSGKGIIVTGASGGIGRVIAETFAKAGASVALIGRDKGKLEQVVQSWDYKDRGFCFSLDVGDPEAVKSTVEQIEDTLPPVGVLVNAAGLCTSALLLRTSPSALQDHLRTNLEGPVYMSKAVLGGMLRRSKGGSIINIGSVVGTAGNTGQVAYSCSKAGLVGLTKSLSKEVSCRGITVNLVTPGYIDVGMTKDMDPEQTQQILERIPMGKFGSANDVAELVLFLATKAPYISGQTISVDGGLML